MGALSELATPLTSLTSKQSSPVVPPCDLKFLKLLSCLPFTTPAASFLLLIGLLLNLNVVESVDEDAAWVACFSADSAYFQVVLSEAALIASLFA